MSLEFKTRNVPSDSEVPAFYFCYLIESDSKRQWSLAKKLKRNVFMKNKKNEKLTSCLLDQSNSGLSIVCGTVPQPMRSYRSVKSFRRQSQSGVSKKSRCLTYRRYVAISSEIRKDRLITKRFLYNKKSDRFSVFQNTGLTLIFRNNFAKKKTCKKLCSSIQKT